MNYGGPRVLIVDDEVDIARSFARVLRRKGYQPLIANDGATALRLIAEVVFDVVVSDVAMPGYSGFELVEEAQRIDATLPVILVTGSPHWLFRTEEQSAPKPYLWLLKPLESELLVRSVLSAVGYRRLAQLEDESLATEANSGVHTVAAKLPEQEGLSAPPRARSIAS